ncbi:MAG: MogA/MoaB family molybdenum cofactor biosynthesis protein [Armatimonadota bacterium]|nr:MogA/MoaB family molybdenum cofactor biosynthesis protein [Armatimonadota bacterium]
MGELIRVGVLTVSDRCSLGEREDLSGPAIKDSLPDDKFVVALEAIVPDDKKIIADTLKRWSDEYECDVILTTGGTGFSPRDVTPEATTKVLDRDAPNISQYLLWESLKQTPFAALSRGVAGVRGATLIVNLPGSPSGAKDNTVSLVPLLPHAVDVLRVREMGHPV